MFTNNSHILIYSSYLGMDSNMKRSCNVENETTRQRSRNEASHSSTNSANDMNFGFNNNYNQINQKEAEQILESRHGNRRVMFAQDFDEDDVRG